MYRERDREVRRGRPPVPSSAMPAPGACRIWNPDERADEQRDRRSGACRTLARRVPLGAWLLHRPQDRPGVLEIAQYSELRRGEVKRVVVYELDRRARQWDPRDDDPGWGRRSGTGGATGDSPFDGDDDPDRDGRGDVVPPR